MKTLSVMTLALVGLLQAACSHTLFVASDPDYAQVSIDGLPRGTTPLEVTVPYDKTKTSVELRVSKPGYHTGIKYQSIDDPNKISIHLEPCQPSTDEKTQTVVACDPETRELNITSTQPGTEVTVRGENRGNAPLKVTVQFRYEKDSVTVVCKKTGYQDFTKVQYVQDPTTINCEMTIAPPPRPANE